MIFGVKFTSDQHCFVGRGEEMHTLLYVSLSVPTLLARIVAVLNGHKQRTDIVCFVDVATRNFGNFEK